MRMMKASLYRAGYIVPHVFTQICLFTKQKMKESFVVTFMPKLRPIEQRGSSYHASATFPANDDNMLNAEKIQDEQTTLARAKYGLLGLLLLKTVCQ